MFYSAELLSIKSNSGLGIVWLAATLGPRSQTKKLSRKDYTSVDIVDSCKYVITPPEPLSLRLASSLMIGITRVYGQQCQIYFADAQHFWSNLASLKGQGPKKTANHPSVKAPKETITMPLVERVSFDGELLLSGILEELMATPEDPRRLSKSMSNRMMPSLGGSSTMVGVSNMLPFEPNETVDAFDFGDFGAWNSGSLSDIDDFKRSLATTGGDGEDFAEMKVPGSVNVKEPAAKRPKVKRAARGHVGIFDEETILGREELLLKEGEGLLPPATVWDIKLKTLFPEMPLNKQKIKHSAPNKRDSTVEQGRGLESGIFEWDPYDGGINEMETPQGHGVALVPGITSSSIGAARLSPLAMKSLSARDGSSPLRVGDNWDIPTEVGLRRDSLDLYGTIVGYIGGEGMRAGARFGGPTVGMKTIVGPNPRRIEVAKCFHNILDLAKMGSIKVCQSGAFAEIKISLALHDSP